MKNKILTISTSDPEQTAILLATVSDFEIISQRIWRAKTHQSEELLPAIDRMLIKNKIKPEDLALVIVDVGPGSFTGIRVGVATANAFGFVLNIPVIGVKKTKNITKVFKKGIEIYKKEKPKENEQALPFYDKKPNITTPKKK